MKKIDLHIHTQVCKQGDGKQRKISPEDFVKTMKDNGVEICSITNHNKFDIEEYNKIQEIDDGLTIFPGMEIDVNLYNGKHRHIIVIASPDKKEKFDKVFDEDLRNYDSYRIEYDSFVSNVKKFDKSEIIIIPHFYLKDKERGLTTEEADRLRTDLKNYIVILEPKSLQAMGIINAHNDLALFGSDVKDWHKYGEIILPEIKYKIDSFAKFYKLADDPSLFIKTILADTKHYLVKDSNQASEYKSLTEPIKIFEDINIIFGEKGSGKTIFVKNYVFPTLKNLGKNVFFHEGKDYKVEYQSIVNELGSKIEKDDDKIFRIKEVVTSLLEYSESNRYDGLQKFIDFRQSELKNKNAIRICKKDAIASSISNSGDIQMVLNDTSRNFKKIDDVITINKDTIRSDSDQRELREKLTLLKVDILNNSKEKIKISFSNKGVINSIDSIKSSIKKQTGSDSAPTQIGLAELISKRLHRIKSNKQLIELFKDIEHKEVNKLGILPQKGEICLETEIKVLSEMDVYHADSVFDRSGISGRRELVKKLRKFDIISDFSEINEYFTPEEKVINIDDFVDKIIKHSNKTILKDKDGNSKNYNPSEGEQAILSISAILENNQYDFYIFDEIERGLGNRYISLYLIPKIKDLRDRGKTIIISTHNANIAINTLPSQTIYCDYNIDNTMPSFYVGNMYNNQLVDANLRKLKWEDVALVHLEGSEEMFTNRRDIYGI